MSVLNKSAINAVILTTGMAIACAAVLSLSSVRPAYSQVQSVPSAAGTQSVSQLLADLQGLKDVLNRPDVKAIAAQITSETDEMHRIEQAAAAAKAAGDKAALADLASQYGDHVIALFDAGAKFDALGGDAHSKVLSDLQVLGATQPTANLAEKAQVGAATSELAAMEAPTDKMYHALNPLLDKAQNNVTARIHNGDKGDHQSMLREELRKVAIDSITN